MGHYSWTIEFQFREHHACHLSYMSIVEVACWTISRLILSMWRVFGCLNAYCRRCIWDASGSRTELMADNLQGSGQGSIQRRQEEVHEQMTGRNQLEGD